MERLDTPVDPGFRACGYLFVAGSEPVLEELAANVALQNRLGIPSTIVGAEEAAELVPGLNGGALCGAAYCGEDGYFDRPQTVVEAFAEAAVREGARIELREVVRLSRDGGGWSLGLDDGTAVAAENVVVAAGYDTAALVAQTGVLLPIEKEPRYLFYSDPIPERLLEPLVIAPERHFAAKQLADGRLLASDLGASGAPEDGRDRWRTRIRVNVHELLPLLEFVSLPLLVEGFYDMTPDRQAVIGAVPGHDGLWVAAGFSGHGFMMAPVVGEWLAERILDGRLRSELELLSPARFETDSLLPESQVV
jgi:sarcosine oxidase subunit beta